ncbi:two-component sensor histidine kinase [Erwinia sp. OLTSP20]|uniref:sensor histidine kinase n=1 Tax=unclassified Erwinia TaxID=2622719 RepID=UPI000C1938ED|nr:MULTISPECIES: HAMP domain-containing sensor histidine kinase [unclassified Erwinia]PIJ52362.1 two-component sensor histidine kinase [Erwinia sp. OAMSP11]PIJ73571.1 two-component sensor histidine kinase [Erwinia sp. OLSSP12]PIJ85388.1 two-component sensor histidine kinase [Erwinia sp. OLCASP19]PIJ87630.1 two-component sensor histidine kinase [Erwinia sp. OLMTSP26]PIJ89136.1 two-component sensor histidine kinase [Erwinia sp. OLMDSP33]
MAFLLVLLPLLVLAWQAWESLSLLSQQAADTNRNTFSDIRRSEAMARTALELERSYRQYCVLGDALLEKLYHTQYTHYASMLDEYVAALPDASAAEKLRQLLPELASVRCAGNLPAGDISQTLEAFSQANAGQVQTTRKVVFSRGLALQRTIAERGQFFGWQALILFIITLALVLLFTRMIIGPVNAVERMINRLGEGYAPSADSAFSGPREIQSLAQRIIWLSERLNWLESQRHEFLRHISHELKTPLASMREGTELLADEVAGPLTADQREVVTILDNSSRHLQQLIEQLLDYNRKLSDAPVNLTQVSLPELVAAVVASHSLPARAKLIRTELELGVSHCQTEATLLSRVLDNLYSNAVHYGKHSATIRISSYQKNQRVFIEVANSGRRIPADEQAMIFEPFWQGSAHRRGAVKGSGLGLSIARDCMRRLQGELRLINRDDVDVCFQIELPLAGDNAQ